MIKENRIFNELILSWNGSRPIKGSFLFYVRVRIKEWTPWLPYAIWGSEGQWSFSEEQAGVRVDQDIVEVLGDKQGTAFEVKVEVEGEASLDNLSLYVYTNGGKIEERSGPLLPVNLEIKGLSQMSLPHDRCRDLCSPSSTCAVVRHLLHSDRVDPLLFANNVWDSEANVFGNWVFNVAEASTHLGGKWRGRVERLGGIGEICASLYQGIPVIVSVRGPLMGSAEAYEKGHLMVVDGYDSVGQRVMCMDPAFPSDEDTKVAYPLADFMEAWGRRGRLAYLFTYRERESSR
jgi:hypothetical protein